MRSGQLRHRLTIQRPTAGSRDAYGSTDPSTWSTLAKVWGEVLDLFGDEALRAAQVTPEATVKITTRYRADVTEDMRIKFGDRLLYPVSLIRDVRSTSLTWFCREER